MRSSVCLALLVVAGCSRAATPAAPSTALADSLAAISGRFATEKRVPGLAVGVMRGGTVVYRAGFGVTALPDGQPVTPSTLFHMASVTKPFVATAIMQLVGEGKVGLDSLVTVYLPYFRMKDPRAATITIRQLVTHTSGMPDVTDYHWDRPEYDDGSLERWVRGLADSSLIAAPGEKWQYSNIGFEILADVIAKVSGQPFEDYVQAKILRPLGMKKSTLLMTDIDSTLMAYGHGADSAGTYHRTGSYPYNRRHAASSTLHSNVDDMLRWGAANLAQGTLDGGRILEPAAYAELWKPQRDMYADLSARAARAGITLPYSKMAVGLSWFLAEMDGHALVNHSGGDTGFRTDFTIAPADSAVVVVLINGEADPRELSNALLKAVWAAPAAR